MPTPNDTPAANLVKDAIGLGPAPTRAREAAVAVTTGVLAAVVLAALQPAVLFIAIASTAVVVNLAIRWIIGTRKWGSR
ncbi:MULTISPECIES: hypothetical protein [unclassified Rhodococcus (in: high G+C Gram-positive bacteria)]|uniref:hypothetical protein n=1 Tax=unclassified Rhodococcus (in: high G+C Gram-positive bacteria) TaxID=192944 RepID=UPI00117B3C8B|nr:hypothetical protein [Rhodococcus sp. 1163]